MTMMTQDVASAVLDMTDAHNRLANGVAALLVIAEEMTDGTLTHKALCFVVDSMQRELDGLDRLTDLALGRKPEDEEPEADTAD